MSIKALFFDIDGTLVVRRKAVPGAAQAIAHARRTGMRLRFLTNITTRTPAAIAADLQELGIAAEVSEIQTASTACVALLQMRPAMRCHLMIPHSALPMFDGIVRDDKNPDAVVIGDFGEGFTYESLNRAFHMLRDGAELFALHKNLHWFDMDEAKLDCGAFILALEAASGKSATVCGKPSPRFFHAALASVGCTADEVLHVGDDPLTDIAGGRAAGISTVLVATGKYAGRSSHNSCNNGYFLPSVATLPDLLTKIERVEWNHQHVI